MQILSNDYWLDSAVVRILHRQIRSFRGRMIVAGSFAHSPGHIESIGAVIFLSVCECCDFRSWHRCVLSSNVFARYADKIFSRNFSEIIVYVRAELSSVVFYCCDGPITIFHFNCRLRLVVKFKCLYRKFSCCFVAIVSMNCEKQSCTTRRICWIYVYKQMIWIYRK